MINSIYNSLAPNGAFMFVEKILCENSFSDSMFSSLYKDYKANVGFSAEEILEKERSLRGVLVPQTSEDNKKILRNAGFKKIDTFFTWYTFEGIIAIK